MTTNLATFAVLICTTLAISITHSANTGAFEFYKLALQWPKSYCNSGNVCSTPILTAFTIHGLWPQYKPDSSVPPFNQSGCTTVTPTPPSGITLALLQPIINDMRTYWPNLRNYKTDQVNLIFWRQEWQRHGMCSAYPAQPLSYFTASLQKIKTYNIRQIFQNNGISPSNSQSYNRNTLSNAITTAVGSRPEIHCNKDSGNVVQLMEVRICFNPQLNPIDCPTPFTACPNGNLVRYPVP